jgi:hypothetical protein
VTQTTRINKRYSTDRLRCDMAHVGLFDVADYTLWIARRRIGQDPLKTSHARMILGGTHAASVAEKDRFVCYWFHTPHTGEGLVHGQAIDWSEGHLMVRLDPFWNYATQKLIRSTDTARLEHNVDQQYRWAQHIFERYAAMGPRYPLNWHMLGPRPADSMFHVQRAQGR